MGAAHTSIYYGLHIDTCDDHLWTDDAPCGVPLNRLATHTFVAGVGPPFRCVCPGDEQTNGVAPSWLGRILS
jgi:hypothetical protein